MYIYENYVDEDERFFIDSYLIRYFSFLSDKKDINRVLGLVFPPLKAEEDRKECLDRFHEISLALVDGLEHDTDILTEYAFQRAFCQIESEKRKWGSAFWSLYYPNKTKKELAAKARGIIHRDCGDDYDDSFGKKSDKEILDFYVEEASFSETCFSDADCLFAEELFMAKNKDVLPEIESQLGIVPKMLAPLLPNSVAKKISEQEDVLQIFLSSFRSIIENSTYRLSGVSGFSEKDFQLLFELYGRGFYRVGFQPNKFFRECDVGNGKIDFCASLPDKMTVVFELKMDDKERVLSSLRSQIPEYMVRSQSDIGVCVVFSNGDSPWKDLYEKEANALSDKDQKIEVFIIDYSQKSSPSMKKSSCPKTR